jgi:peptidoglycan/xylan/chitin deacetylase (PgdA/CDA1 family)
MFHAIDHHHDVLGLLPTVFENLMQNLESHHMQGLTLSTLSEAMQTQDNQARFCALTFDDGYASIFENAMPLMEKYQHKATVFLTVGADGDLMEMSGRQMLNWEQIRELHQMGYEIGAHTETHPDLRQISDAQLIKEIINPKKIIEDKLGDAVTTFAYPFGYYDKRSAEMVSEHYDYAVTTELRYAKMTDEHNLLPRLETYYLRPKVCQSLMGSEYLPAYMAMRALPRALRQRFTSNAENK